MPLGLDYVDRVNKEQRLARERFNQGQALTNEGLSDIQNSAVGRALGLPRINELEQFIFKLRTELINYLIENAYIDGLKFDGLLYKPEGGKIVITADMIQAVVSKFGYITNQEAAELIAKTIGDGDFASKPWVGAYVTQYLVDHFYVADEHYVSTDNNFTDADKDKLDGLEILVEDVQLNGTSVLNRETKVANVIITDEMVKEWYESNPDTNALTDAEKLKLSRVPDDLQTVLDEIIAHERSHDLDIIEIKQLNARQETHLTQLDAEQVTQNINIEENKQNIINLTKDVALIKRKDESQDSEIAALKEKDVEQDAAISGLNTEIDDATANIAGLQADVTSMRKLLNKKVSDVTLDGTTVVDENMTAVFTASMIKASYESNPDTNVFTDDEKQKLQDVGSDLDDATANIAGLQADVTSMRNLLNKKVSDVTLDGTTVVDENMTAVFTASMIKASYESNPDTNVFTDDEKQVVSKLYNSELNINILKPFQPGTYIDKATNVVTDYFELVINPEAEASKQLSMPFTLLTAYSECSPCVYLALNSIVKVFSLAEYTPGKYFDIWDKVPKTLELLKRFDIWPITFGYVVPESQSLINGISTLPASSYMAFKSDGSGTTIAGEAYTIVPMGLRFGYKEKPVNTIPEKKLYLYLSSMQGATRYIGSFIAAVHPVAVTSWPFTEDRERGGRNLASSTLIISK